MKNKGVEEAYKRQMEGMNIRKSMKESKKLSSCVLTKKGVFALDNFNFVAGFHDQIEEKRQEAKGRAKKQCKVLASHITKVKAESSTRKEGPQKQASIFQIQSQGVWCLPAL